MRREQEARFLFPARCALHKAVIGLIYTQRFASKGMDPEVPPLAVTPSQAYLMSLNAYPDTSAV